MGHQEGVNCVDFHPNANYVISGSDDRSIRLWDINSGKFERVFFMSNQGVSHYHGLTRSLLWVNLRHIKAR